MDIAKENIVLFYFLKGLENFQSYTGVNIGFYNRLSCTANNLELWNQKDRKIF